MRDGNPADWSSGLENPGGVAVDRDGNTYVAETAANRVRMISKATGLISTVAGTGSPGFFGDGGPDDGSPELPQRPGR